MEIKIAVVTGASGGLGSQLCKQLAAKGIHLVVVGSKLPKAEAFAAELNRLYPRAVDGAFAADLSSHADIGGLVGQILAKYDKIDYLFNNAGVLTETLQFSGHGNELHFEVNTLAPLQLIDGLRPALAKADGAKIVSTSAGLSTRAKELDFDNLVRPQSFSKLFGPYVNSKQALNVLAAALAPELRADNIIIRTSDPGPNQTGLTKGKGTPLWMRLFYKLLPTPDKGAKNIFDAAAASNWADQSGIFVLGKKTPALPPALADPKFQADFLARCRERAALI